MGELQRTAICISTTVAPDCASKTAVPIRSECPEIFSVIPTREAADLMIYRTASGLSGAGSPTSCQCRGCPPRCHSPKETEPPQCIISLLGSTDFLYFPPRLPVSLSASPFTPCTTDTSECSSGDRQFKSFSVVSGLEQPLDSSDCGRYGPWGFALCVGM